MFQAHEQHNRNKPNNYHTVQDYVRPKPPQRDPPTKTYQEMDEPSSSRVSQSQREVPEPVPQHCTLHDKKLRYNCYYCETMGCQECYDAKAVCPQIKG